MEDFEAAFLQRVKDVEVLHTADRRAATMHFGGIVIECLLKHLIFTSLPKDAKKEWKTDTNNPGHTFKNPGHDFEYALRCNNKLWFRVQREKHIQMWLNEIENPSGHFIDIRYVGEEPDDVKYRHWWKSYQGLLGWLQKNSTRI